VIVVAGGTGTLGARLVPLLADQGLAVRVLTRDADRAQHLSRLGIEVACGDVRDPASLAGAAPTPSSPLYTASPGPVAFRPQR
jgi:uncharacterized protein YbjT (DUF2867 family)